MKGRPVRQSLPWLERAYPCFLVGTLLLLLVPANMPAHGFLDVTGAWDLTVQTKSGTAHPSILLKQDGEKITGTYQGRMGNSPLEGTIRGDDISFTVRLKFQETLIAVTYRGAVTGDTMKGTVQFGEGDSGSWSGTRKKSVSH